MQLQQFFEVNEANDGIKQSCRRRRNLKRQTMTIDRKLKQSGTLQMKNAIGAIAETYLFIPPKREGFGKIHIKVQGSLHELQAITDDEIQIATGKLVKVTGLVNDSVLIVTANLS